MKVNYHTHSRFCDGKGEPEDYIIEAISRGFSSLGFSAHAPLKEENTWTLKNEDVESYIETIIALKEKYRDRITIQLGMEVDFYPDENRCNTFREYNLDYIIGSVHMVKPEGYREYYSVDESREAFINTLNSVFPSIKEFAVLYFKTLRAMIEQGGFEILGHLDLIKKFNKDGEFFSEDEPWYREEIFKTLDLLEGKNIIVEMNTGALSRGVHDIPYPSEWIIRECRKRDIKMCLNSDAHAPNGLDCYFNESLDILRSCGYTQLTTPFEIIEI